MIRGVLTIGTEGNSQKSLQNGQKTAFSIINPILLEHIIIIKIVYMIIVNLCEMQNYLIMNINTEMY
jgi:hypothetical protein